VVLPVLGLEGMEDRFQVCGFVRKEFNDCFVPSQATKDVDKGEQTVELRLFEDLEGEGQGRGGAAGGGAGRRGGAALLVGLVLTVPLHDNDACPSHRQDKHSFQCWIQQGALFLVLIEHFLQPFQLSSNRLGRRRPSQDFEAAQHFSLLDEVGGLARCFFIIAFPTAFSACGIVHSSL